MNVKEAVQIATAYVADVFAAETITNIGLEEVTFDSMAKEWVVTVGFSRPWDYPKPNGLSILAAANLQPSRVYKTIRLNDHAGEVLSIKNRE